MSAPASPNVYRIPAGVATDSTESSTHLASFSDQGFVEFDPVSDEVRQIYQTWVFVVLCGLLSVIGIGTNIVSIVVFVKLGFREGINISLLGLAVADLACVVTMFWSSICYNPFFLNLNLPFNSMDVMYLTGGYTHACFNRITSLITAFISLERCLCITFPLKVKNIITPFRTKVINIAIFVVICILFSPFYFVNKLAWQFDPSINRTIFRLVYSPNKETVETVIFPIHSVGLSIVLLFFVAICTIIIIINLNRKTKWRQSSASSMETASVKDKKVVKMVTFISSIFIICFIPGTLNFFMMAYEPQFNFNGKYENMFCIVWSTAFSLETFSSTINLFVYLKMSSNFRRTFLNTFCRCFRVSK